MEFTSLYFILLTVISVLIYYLIRPKYRVAFLSLLSCGFIGSLSLNLLIYVVAFTVLNYFIGIYLLKLKKKKVLFSIGIVINLLQLVVLKYADFTLNPIVELLGINFDFLVFSRLIVPIGISYFTLQGIGYLFNINKGWEKPERNFLNFLLYIVFFPKFLSGPIERSNHFLPQTGNGGAFNRDDVSAGFRLILIGFLKKDVIANQLSLLVNPVYGDVDGSGGWLLLLVILVQPLYLYFDFSGYTDIAIGIARSFGYKLLPNFDKPFFAENITTFWKKFHMSLAFWFNDYVFKQLVFKYRKWGINASIFGVFVTWLLFGIWHGAGWHFMILGLMQALAINGEFLTRRKRMAFFSKYSDKVRIFSGRIYTYVFYGISLVFFFSKDLPSVFRYFGNMFNFEIVNQVNIENKTAFIISVVILLVFMLIEYIYISKSKLTKHLDTFWNSSEKSMILYRFIVYYVVIVSIFYLGGLQTAFIYFQF